MSRYLTLLTGAALLLFVSGVFGQTAEKEKPAETEKIVTDSAQKAEAPPKEITVVGEWEITPNKRTLKGVLLFKDDGTYERTETDPKNVTATVKGEYIIDKTQKPCAIDLCLNKCGGAGSEWTTMFGIMRFLDDGRLELFFSPDGKRPAAFDDAAEDGVYLLTRKASKE